MQTTPIFRHSAFWRHMDRILGAMATRVILSALILASILPVDGARGARTFFLVVFGIETIVRAGLLIWRFTSLSTPQKLQSGLFLLADLVATLSFLPQESLGVSAEGLRVARLARLVLLLAYWGPYFRDFFQIGMRRERMNQLALIGAFSVLLSATGAGALRLMDLSNVDINGDGVPGQVADREMTNLLWWAFLQVEDPGNITRSTQHVGLLVVSLVLTGGGLLLMALLIGLGASLVEELFAATRYRPLYLSRHTLILNAQPSTVGILREIATYYRKILRRPKIVVMGSSPQRPDYLDSPEMRRFRYVPGLATNVRDLERVSTASARRLILLATGAGQESDAQTMTAALAVRALNPELWLYAELFEMENAQLLHVAHTALTQPVLAQRLATLVLGHAVWVRGSEQLFGELLSSRGQEIYTTISGMGMCEKLPEILNMDGHFPTFMRVVYRHRRTMVLGVVVRNQDDPMRFGCELYPFTGNLSQCAGFVGICDKFLKLREVTEQVANTGFPSAAISLPEGIGAWRRELFNPKHILIIGFHEDSFPMVEQFVQRCEDRLFIRILVGEKRKRDRVFGRMVTDLAQPPLQKTCAEPDGSIRISRSDGAQTIISVEVKDRLTLGLYREELGKVDVIVLLRRDRTDVDPDAATVVGVLRILSAVQHTAPENLPTTRIVVELHSPDKIPLLEAHLRGQPFADQIAMVCTEQLRERIVAQSLFVPGLTDLYLDLLANDARRVVRLAMECPASGYADVVDDLIGRSGLVPLGAAIRCGETGQVRVEANPDFSKMERDHKDTVVGVYVVGTFPFSD